MPINIKKTNELHSIWQFDENVTAPLHGFKNAEEYYRLCSARQYLRNIRTQTLIVHAADDPFMTTAVIPTSDMLPPSVLLEVHAHGGHVGFVGGKWPWRPQYWLEERIPEYFAGYFK